MKRFLYPNSHILRKLYIKQVRRLAPKDRYIASFYPHKKYFKMKEIFLLCLFSIGIYALSAQEVDENNSVELAKLYLNPISFQGFENPNLRMAGTPFLAEKWQYGNIEVADGYSKEVQMALNLEDQMLFIKLSNNKEFQIPNNKLEGLRIEQEDKTYLELESHNLLETYGIGPKGYKYYEPLHKGEKYTLWELHTKFLRKEEYMENLGMVRRPNEYKSLYEYWLLNEKGELLKVKRNVKALGKILPKEAKRIKAIVKQQGLSLKDSKDFGKLFAALEE